MSAKEMEQMDEEVMAVVNSHATPESMTNADAIVKQETAQQPVENPLPDLLEETQSDYRISKQKFAELEARAEVAARRKTLTVLVLCALLAVALLVVLAKPSLLIWLVNIGVATCAVIAGIAIDRRWGR